MTSERKVKEESKRGIGVRPDGRTISLQYLHYKRQGLIKKEPSLLFRSPLSILTGVRFEPRPGPRRLCEEKIKSIESIFTGVLSYTSYIKVMRCKEIPRSLG